MQAKIENWFVLIISSIILLGIVWTLYVDINFFCTKREAEAEVISILKPSDYRIRLSYYNEYLKNRIEATAKIQSSYKDKVEHLGNTVEIFYSTASPKSVYIKSLKSPNVGIVIFQMIAGGLIFLAIIASIQGLQNKK